MHERVVVAPAADQATDSTRLMRGGPRCERLRMGVFKQTPGGSSPERCALCFRACVSTGQHASESARIRVNTGAGRCRHRRSRIREMKPGHRVSEPPRPSLRGSAEAHVPQWHAKRVRIDARSLMRRAHESALLRVGVHPGQHELETVQHRSSRSGTSASLSFGACTSRCVSGTARGLISA